jgi:hypothetical protein
LLSSSCASGAGLVAEAITSTYNHGASSTSTFQARTIYILTSLGQ